MSHYADRRIHGNAVFSWETEAKMLCTSSALKGPRSIPLLCMQMISRARIACHVLVYISGPISDERASGRAGFGFWKMPFSISPFYCFFPFYHSPFFSARVRVKSMWRRRRRREAPCGGANNVAHVSTFLSFAFVQIAKIRDCAKKKHISPRRTYTYSRTLFLCVQFVTHFPSIL